MSCKLLGYSWLPELGNKLRSFIYFIYLNSYIYVNVTVHHNINDTTRHIQAQMVSKAPSAVGKDPPYYRIS